MEYRTYQVIEIIGNTTRYICTFDGDELSEAVAYSLGLINDYIRETNLSNHETHSVGAVVIKDVEYLSGYHLHSDGSVVLKMMIEAYR